MRTNIEIDDNRIKEVMDYFKVSTKKEAVDLALKEVLRLKGLEVTKSLRGSGWGWPDNEVRRPKQTVKRVKSKVKK